MGKMTPWTIAWLAGAALCLVPQAAQAGPETVYAFDLPAQDLGDALRAVAARAGLELYAVAAEVNGVPAPRLHGSLTARQAVAQLLAGSALRAHFSQGAIVIAGRSGEGGAAAAGLPDADIVVTGTHLHGGTPSSPVKTASRRQIEEEGHHDLGEFIRTIPENFTGGQNPGVAGGGNQGGSNINVSSSSALNLRGLGPDATLTLLNGHRLAYDSLSQGVDIAQIPLMAIDRVEVLTDGSSALYGSDAVGGVANVILRRDYKGALVSARIGGSTEGGNFQQQYDALTGARWTGGGVMIAGTVTDISAITAGQRDETARLDPSATLVPWQRQISVIATGHQDLGEGLTLEFDAQYNNRLTQTSAPFLTTTATTSNGLVTRPTVNSANLSGTLRWDIGGSWRIAATGVYGLSHNHLLARQYLGGVQSLRSQLNYNDDLASGEIGADGTVIALPGGDAKLAVGGGYRRAGLGVLIQQERGGVSTVTRRFNSERPVWFGYGEISLPLVGEGNRMPLVERLQIDAAARFEDYPGNAHLLTPKVGIEYRPDPAVTFRAGWGKSFKTQTLYQQYQGQEGDLLPSEIFPGAPLALPVLLLTGGNPDLKPERATTWNVGITVAPPSIPELVLRATWFDIHYRDRVVAPVTNLLGVFADPTFAAYVTTAPSAATVSSIVAALPQGLSNQTGNTFDPAAVGAIVNDSLQNAERQHVRGLDLLARYTFHFANKATLRIDGTASYLESSQQLSAGYPDQTLAGTIFNPPHWRGRLGAVWQRESITLSGFGSYIGGTLDNRVAPYQRVASFRTFDILGQWRSPARQGPAAGLTLTLSAQNLFDAKPGLIRNSIPTDPPYDSTNYSIAGRVISAAIAKAF